MPHTHPRLLVRSGAVAVATTALLVGLAGPASAHVRVTSSDAAPGGFGVITFRVPTESDTASTVALSVDLPKDTPFAFVTSRVLPGWTVSAPEVELGRTVKSGDFSLTKAVTRVTWTAAKGQGIAPHQFSEFALSVGPFPTGAKQLVFPARQTYSDGKVVAWDELQAAGAEEPENPAPVLPLAAANVPSAGSPAPATQAVVASGSSSESDGTARGLGIAALVISVVAAGLAALGLRRRTT